MQRCGGSSRTLLYACRWVRSWVIWLRVHGEILFPHRGFQEYVAGLHVASFSGHANDTSEGLEGFPSITSIAPRVKTPAP